nr:ingression protein fic1 [Quercus suber]
MSTKTALPQGFTSGAMHTAGIFSDMTVDGPEIGTLVLVVDRAKNLPNRKTMGKQNPYCAARLGKEAKKTETDKRGGQTPKWDQELRFTVHESPDYDNLKISVFSEDKRTDLIGEAWLGLTDVVVPGGGKNDVWQSLNYKGKYAGEIRIELTYYDSRPKPEKTAEEQTLEHQSLSHSDGSSRMKRRPLPSNPNSAFPENSSSSSTAPVRAKHGPRDYRAPTRAMSMPPEAILPAQPRVMQQSDTSKIQSQRQGSDSNLTTEPQVLESRLPEDGFPRPWQYTDPYQQSEFLPQLPPRGGQRTAQPRPAVRAEQTILTQTRPYSDFSLSHSHSAPIMPILPSDAPELYKAGQQKADTSSPEPEADTEYGYQRPQSQWNSAILSRAHLHLGTNASTHQDSDDEDATPPPPPLHSHSSPAIPQQRGFQHELYQPSASTYYAQASFDDRRQNVSLSTLSQSIESGSQDPPGIHDEHNRLFNEYSYHNDYSNYRRMPQSLIPGQQSSPRTRISTNRPIQPITIQSMQDVSYDNLSRPQPLSHELPGSHSLWPHPELPGSTQQLSRDAHISDLQAPVMKPRALSPRPTQTLPPSTSQFDRRPQNSYSIQFPVRAFESSEQSPLSTAQRPPQPTAQPFVARKSVSPRPSTNSGNSTPYGPDSFHIHNPNAKQATLPSSNSPHSPYQISPDDVQLEDNRGPIVGWHGQEIDPSDHLPVNSWAPEPEKKTPTKKYGLGRDHDFGPRSTQSVSTLNGRISKDTIVNVRMGTTPNESDHSSPSRARLTKKSPAPSRSPAATSRDHHTLSSVPDPYAQPEFGEFYDRGHNASSNDYPPSLPPKVPFGYDQYNGNNESLQKELASIDIGSSSSRHQRAGSMPSPTAFVPVRSHRDRMSYY